MDEYEYEKHHRPIFPSEWQWEQFKGMQRVRFWMWAILGLLSIGMFGLLLWESFADGVGRDFAVGMIIGTLLSCLTFSVTRPRVMRWFMRLRKRDVGTPRSEKSLVDWGFACGRCYLEVAGYVVAMEGDPMREIRLSSHYQTDIGRAFGESERWTGDLIKRVAQEYRDLAAVNGVKP